MNEDEPASEQFDLGESAETPDVDAADLDAVARELERAVESEMDVSDTDAEDLAELSAACKRLEDATEEARKDIFEDELGDRVDDGERVGPLSKQSGRNTWVTDDEGAFAAVAEAGEDPMDVASVSIGDLRDVLGEDASEFIGESEYSYFRRVA